ncbi:MAG: hypothetical protein MUF10_13085 [Thermoanaerobaculaceae bacterium]|nr:hypothetical protein [Thermoanaerobaculaceae bacterium]
MGNVFVADMENCTIRLGSPTLADAATIDQPSGLVGQVRQLDTAPQTATSWMWEVVRRPSGGTAQLSDSTARNPTIIPDRTDLWEFRLTAEGPGGKSISLVTFLAQHDAEPRVRRRLARLP